MANEFRSFRVEAVVLKHNEQGEADRMLTLYTRERGKIRALAKGVRKLRSRKAGHLEPFTHASIQLAEGKYWYVVSQAEAQNTYTRLRENLEKVGYAWYVVEMLDKFIFEEEESNHGIFRLLVETLHRLDSEDDPFPPILYFEVQLLDLLGFRPELKSCVVTHEEIKPEAQFFSAALGGVVSPGAAHGLAGTVPVSLNALKYLRHFQRSSYKDTTRAKITPEVRHELESLMQHYITYVLERGMNSPAFLRQIRRPPNQD